MKASGDQKGLSSRPNPSKVDAKSSSNNASSFSHTFRGSHVLQNAIEVPKPTILCAKPSSIHFGGFALNQVYEQKIWITNTGNKPVQLNFTFPSKDFFQISFPMERKSFVPSGLSEEMVVRFKPHAFQYFYDCIQVQCEQIGYETNTNRILLGSLLVPLHAYPVVNKVQFPSRMDFGMVPLGGIVKKSVEISCSVPIEFEYEIKSEKEIHPAFTLHPMKGIVPANGRTHIEIEYRPLVHTTTSSEVYLDISQFGFQKMKCTLTGTSSIEATHEAKVVERKTSLTLPVGTTANKFNPDDEEKENDISFFSSPTPSGKYIMKTSTKKKSSSLTKKQEDINEEIGGIQIPSDLNTVSGVNFILTQQPGKLKPKDLKKAIDANRAMRKQQKKEQEKLKEKLTSGLSTVDGEKEANSAVGLAALTFDALMVEEHTSIERRKVTRQIKELFFLQELSEIQQSENELEFQSQRYHLGQVLLTKQQVNLLQHVRASNQLAQERTLREKQRQVFENQLFHAKSTALPSPMSISKQKCVVLPANFQANYIPDFKTYKNDLWTRRKRIVQRFIRTVSILIVRRRATTRLQKIKQWIGNSTHTEVKKRVAKEWDAMNDGIVISTLTTNATNNNKHSATTNTPSPTTTIGTLVKQYQLDEEEVTNEENVYPIAKTVFLHGFPLVKEEEKRPLEEEKVSFELKFDHFDFFPVQPQDEALLVGHEIFECPPVPTYVPLEQKRSLRKGAMDEIGVRHEKNATDALDKIELLTKPVQFSKTTLLSRLPSNAFLAPNAALRVFTPIQSPRETDSWYIFRPQRIYRTPRRTFGAFLEENIGTTSIWALSSQPSLFLHETYLPQTQRQKAIPLLMTSTSSLSTPTTSTRRELENDGHINNDVAFIEDLEFYEDIWFTSKSVPELLTQAQEVPFLSDSESDDEEENCKKRPLPTWKDALSLFDDEVHFLQNETNETLFDEAIGGKQAAEASILSSGRLKLKRFERYNHLIEQERAYNNYREELHHRLPLKLQELAKEIDDVEFQLVIEGHGPERPLHHHPFSNILRGAKSTTTSSA